MQANSGTRANAHTSIVIYTDGAASGNPGPGGWGAIVRCGDDHVEELGGGAAHTTNNRMEMTAVIEALRFAADRPGPVVVYSDSTYVIKGITEWIDGWKRRGWRTSGGEPVANRELWEAIDELVRARGRAIRWVYVRGHRGVPGNERVDEIAVAHTRGEAPSLYSGPVAAYGIDLTGPPPSASTGSSTSRASRRGAAYSYLSLVNGVLRRHATWAACEARVKGRSGARFKKAMTAAEEADIVRGWGLDPGQLPPR